MRRLLLVGALAVGALVASPTPASAWISGCSAWSSGRYYSAHCSSGNARYFSRATCYKPKVATYTDYGTYVWYGTTSTGSCPWGYLVSNPGWTQ
jgi:hypothetical protein